MMEYFLYYYYKTKTFVPALYDKRVINKNLLILEIETYYFSIMDIVYVDSYSESL